MQEGFAKAHEFDLAVRSRLLIGAPPQKIWDCLENLRAWKPSVVGVERLAGEPGQVGEILRVAQLRADRTVSTILRTLCVDPLAWKVQSLRTEANDAAEGYLIYTLEERRGVTQVTAEFIAHCEFPAAELGDLSLEEFYRLTHVATVRKLDEDHQRLKALAESDTGPPMTGGKPRVAYT